MRRYKCCNLDIFNEYLGDNCKFGNRIKINLTITKLNIIFRSTAFLLLALSLLNCSNSNKKLIIATAANTQFAIEQIVEDFQANSDIDIELVISSSGKHTAQIVAGAPYDLFISADMRYPEHLYQNNLTTEAPIVYAYGQLVLWSMREIEFTDFAGLANMGFDHFAIPNPETAPYGISAQQALKATEQWDILYPRFVFGESVAQTNQYIISGAAEIGFTAASIVLAPKNQGTGHWQYVPDSLYTPLAQGMVVLKNSEKQASAQKFYEYLLSKKSQETLKTFGYKIEAAQ